MSVPRCPKALVLLLFVNLVACSSNSERSPASTGQWFSCQAAESRGGWNCREGYIGDSTSAPVPAQASTSAIESNAESSSSSAESQTSSASTLGQDSMQSPIQKPELEQAQAVAGMAVSEVQELSVGQDTGKDLGINYSVQLAAFTTEERRESFLAQIPVARSELILEKAQRDGKSWWLVLYGGYQNYQQALEGQEYLFGTYGVSNTWIKPLN